MYVLHINRSSLNLTQYYTWLPIRYVVCCTGKNRGTSTTLEREHGNKTKQNKNGKKKGITQTTCQKKIEEGHSVDRVGIPPAASHPIPLGSQLSRICTERHSIYYNKNSYSVLSGFQVSLSALSRCYSKTSQARYSHPRFSLNLVFFRFSLSLPVFERLFLFLHPHNKSYIRCERNTSNLQQGAGASARYSRAAATPKALRRCQVIEMCEVEK